MFNSLSKIVVEHSKSQTVKLSVCYLTKLIVFAKYFCAVKGYGFALVSVLYFKNHGCLELPPVL